MIDMTLGLSWQEGHLWWCRITEEGYVQDCIGAPWWLLGLISCWLLIVSFVFTMWYLERK